VDGFLVGLDNESSLAASDETDVEWFVGHDVRYFGWKME
jgi:hypothetical protein